MARRNYDLDIQPLSALLVLVVYVVPPMAVSWIFLLVYLPAIDTLLEFWG
jgi:hypothetical protein